MLELKMTTEHESSQLLIINRSSAMPSVSNLERNTPIQTYAFIDLETSGTNGSKITEFAVIAVSRCDLEKMQTRIRTAIPLEQPGNRTSNSSSVHVKSDFNCENEWPQNDESISLSQKVKRRLFAAANHDESVEADSSMERSIQVEDQLNGTMGLVMNGNVSNSVNVSHNMNKISASEVLADRKADVEDQKSNKRSHNQEQEMTPSRATIDVATDSVSIVQRHCNSHFYKVPEIPRRMTKLTQLFNPKRQIYPDTEFCSDLNNIGLEDYPVLSNGFCNAFKELIFNLPKPVCLVAHNGEAHDFPIIVSEFLHATNCQFDWGDVVYADSLEVFKLLDKIETHLEFQKVQLLIDKHLDWFLDDSVFAVPNPPPCKRRCTDAQQHDDEGASNHEVTHMVDSSSEIVDPQPGCSTGYASCTPQRPTTSDSVEVGAYQRTPKLMIMPSPLRPCPETPVTPSSCCGGGRSSTWSIQNPSPSLCGSLFTPPQSPVVNTSAVSGSSSNRQRAPPSASKSTPLYFPPQCSFKSMVQITMAHKEYNLGLPKYTRPFSQLNIYERFFGRKYNAHRAEADCQALLELTGHYGLLFTRTVDIIKRPMAKIKPKVLTTRIVQSLKSKKDEQ